MVLAGIIPRALPNEQTVKPCHFHGTLGMVKVVPMAEYLLSNNTAGDGGKTEERYTSQLGTNDTQRVARAIEANIDMATLFAFAQAPHAASLSVTRTHDRSWCLCLKRWHRIAKAKIYDQ